MILIDYMFIAATINCDESGTIVVVSCDRCPYELYWDDNWNYYIPGIYEYGAFHGAYCSGDCSWNSYLDECQIKGFFLMTTVYVPIEKGSHISLCDILRDPR